MLIIAISHGVNCDKPYSQELTISKEDIKIPSLRNIMVYMENKSIITAHFNEIYVLDNDKVLYHFTDKDIDEDFEQLDDDEYEVIEEVAA